MSSGISAESGPGRPPEVPRVSAVLLPARLAASVRRAGPAGRVAPPPAGPAPAREAGARRRQQEQEGPPEPHCVHGAAADGSGEALREAEVPVHARQVSPAWSAEVPFCMQ